MGTRVGEIEYDDAAALKYGAQYPEKAVSTELTILYEDDEDDEEMDESESELPERKLEKFSSGSTVYD